MNGINYLADTNCFIYLLDDHPLISSLAKENWAHSYITEIELLSKSTITPQIDLLIRSMLLTSFKVNHTQNISEIAIGFRRKYNIKLPDAIIAATAQLLNIPLLTTDKGFAKIKDFNCFILDL
jgi:predicted nucleic acid-binding protein